MDIQIASRKARAATLALGSQSHNPAPAHKQSIQSIAFFSIKAMRDDPESSFLLLSKRPGPLGFWDGVVISRPDVVNACDIAKTAEPADAMAWFKTVTNAWCTSSRLNEPVTLNCIFGCGNEIDRISHYLECHVLGRFGLRCSR